MKRRALSMILAAGITIAFFTAVECEPTDALGPMSVCIIGIYETFRMWIADCLEEREAKRKSRREKKYFSYKIEHIDDRYHLRNWANENFSEEKKALEGKRSKKNA